MFLECPTPSNQITQTQRWSWSQFLGYSMGRHGQVSVHRDQREYPGNRRPPKGRSHRADLDLHTIYKDTMSNQSQNKVNTRSFQSSKTKLTKPIWTFFVQNLMKYIKFIVFSQWNSINIWWQDNKVTWTRSITACFGKVYVQGNWK